ncbi:MAG TPA: Fur family transcriptional regulator [Chloroflexota bacterium]|jgi:Fe2+ or Zn2+ uptake regulation protein|nr:Fur family transcriptional regulator [Chloroflexota bacterium]
MIRTTPRDVFAALQAHGHKLTQPRRLVIETLVDQSRAMTANDLHQVLAERGVSLASIYRTLELMSELHLAEPVHQSGDEARYIACRPEHHHHIICTGCWRVADVDSCLLEPVANAIHEQSHFDVESHILEFYGRCAACRR